MFFKSYVFISVLRPIVLEEFWFVISRVKFIEDIEGECNVAGLIFLLFYGLAMKFLPSPVYSQDWVEGFDPK